MNQIDLKRNAIIIEWAVQKYIHPVYYTHDVYMVQYIGDCKVLDDQWQPVNVNTFLSMLLQEVMFSELRHIINVVYEMPITGTNHMFRIDRVSGKW
jgi:hypothetical protein